MPFDDAKWSYPAKQGQVAGAKLDVAVLITQVVRALNKIEAKTGVDLSEERGELTRLNRASYDAFVTMTGWTSDE